MKLMALFTLCVLTLSGCASTIKSAAIDKNQGLQAGQGVVAVQVVNNTDKLAKLHPNWTEVLVIRTDNTKQLKQQALEKAQKSNPGKVVNEDELEWGPDIYSLVPQAEGVVDSQLYVGTMPTGDYMIAKLWSYYNDGNVSSWVGMPVFGSAGTFKVAAGKFTSLNTLVFQPLLNVTSESFWSNTSSQKAYVTRIEGNEHLDKALLQYYPKLASQLDLTQIAGWDSNKHDDVRKTLGKLSRDNAYGNRALVANTNTKGIVTAKFGQLRWLGNDGQWHQANLPTNSHLLSATELSGLILVGGERGQLFSSKTVDGEWSVAMPVAANEAIVWMGKGKTENYAVTTTGQQTYVYSLDGEGRNWKRIHQLKPKEKNFFVLFGGLFPLITKDGSLRILNDEQIHDFNAATAQWTTSKGTALYNMAQLADGRLVGLEVSQWDGVGDQLVSLNDGQSWQAIDRTLELFGDKETELSLPALTSDGLVASLGRIKKDKKTSDQLFLISTSHANLGKKNVWTTHHPVKEGCYTMLPQLTQGSRLFFLCEQGNIVSTSDYGKNWSSVVSIDLAKMQQVYETLLSTLKESEKPAI